MASDQELARIVAAVQDRMAKANRASRLERASVIASEDGTRSVGVRQALLGSRAIPLEGALALLPYITTPEFSLWFTPAQPDPVAGHLWLSPETVLYGVSAGGWEPLSDQAGAPALAALREALVTDDGRIDVWQQVLAPGPASFGDLWFTAEGSPYRWEGSWVALIPAQTQSATYVPGEEGWGFQPDGDAQVKDLSALGLVSAPQVNAGAIQLGDTDLQWILDQFPKGKILEANKMSNTEVGPIVAVEARLFKVAPGDRIIPNRSYRLTFKCHLQREGTLAAVDSIDLKFRYTLDGSDPTITSPLLGFVANQGHGTWRYAFDNTSTSNNHDVMMDVAFDTAGMLPGQELKFILTGIRTVGSASFVIYQVPNSNRDSCFEIFDEGPSGTRDNNTAQQLLGLTESNPVSTYTKTIPAAWAYGIDTAGNLIYNSYFVTGNNAFGAVGSFGLVGFDSAAVIAALANSITPISCTLKYTPRARSTAAGLDLRLLTHNYASRAAAQAVITWPEDYTSSGTLTSVATMGNLVPGTRYSYALGTTRFNNFKAGTMKGVGFANSATDQYASHPDGTGSVYGDVSNEMQLVFVYSGTS